MIRFFGRLFLFCAIFLVAPLSAPATILPVTIAWSPVGNPGNAADPATGGVLGAVAYSYNIDTYDVTQSQYVEFLNANDPTGVDPLALYNININGYGITYNSGNANGSKYGIISGDGNRPVVGETWYDAIRFANWMDNGQPVYTVEPTAINNATDNGAYTLQGYTPTPSNANSIMRNTGATIFLPNETEWYKAAFYNPATQTYYLYPTSSNTAPTASLPTATPDSANYNAGFIENNITDVGAYSGTTSPYGEFDMAGDVNQWIENLLAGDNRGLRGGSLVDTSAANMRSSGESNAIPSEEVDTNGFRLVSIGPVPEPSSIVLLCLASIGAVGCALRCRRIA